MKQGPRIPNCPLCSPAAVEQFSAWWSLLLHADTDTMQCYCTCTVTFIYQTFYHLLYFYVQLYILCTLTTIATSTQNHWATMVRRTKSVQTGTQCVCTWYSTKTLVLLFSPCSLKYVTKPKPCQIHIWLHSFVGQYFTFLTFQIER